jgi:DNA-binding MarR family transcriptional regulator
MQADHDLLALDRQVCFALTVAGRAVVQFYRPILEPLGLTHPQYLVMLALWERAPRRFGEVAGALHLDPATLTPLVRRLETMGLVQRRRAADDERAVELSPTAAGLELRERATAVPREVIDRLEIPIAELERVRDDLNGLITAIDAADGRARINAARSSAPR